MNLEHALGVIASDINPAEDREAVCRVAEHIFAHKSEIKHLSYSAIAQLAQVQLPEQLLKLTQYLVGERTKLLEMKFELIIDNEITPLDDETIYHAETSGELIHPETGIAVDNYDRYVYPYFIVSPEVDNG